MLDTAGMRQYRLSPVGDGHGISCDERGAFVGEIPLLNRGPDASGREVWAPRTEKELNEALSSRYGLTVDFAVKAGGLAAIVRALNGGDLALAKIATLHLRLPDPPSLAKGIQSAEDTTELAALLHSSGILKGDWNPDQHPRWPAGEPDDRGGQFRSTDDSSSAEDSSPIVPAQATIVRPMPLPWDIPLPAPPSEITPPPLDIPKEQERERRPLVNPFPRKRKCVEEWSHALDFCEEQDDNGKLKPGYGGFGKDFYSCVMGQVSEECGGNRLEA